MVTSGSLGGEVVSTLARNTRDVRSISALSRHNISQFYQTHDTSAVTRILYTLCTHCMVVEPTMYMSI